MTTDVSKQNNVAIVKMFDGYIRNLPMKAVARHRLLMLLKYVQEEAQIGEPMPDANALFSVRTVEELLALIAATANVSVKEIATDAWTYLITAEQAAKDILSDVNTTNWFSVELKKQAESTQDPDIVEALQVANRSLAIVENCVRFGQAG